MAAEQAVGKVFDDEQRVALDIDGNLVVNACPGSGKTTLVVGKIIKELGRLEGTAQAVLCLTFTRAAVRSIKDKLRSSVGDSELPGCIVSTIHGFVLRQIFLPYSRLVGFERGLRLVGPSSIEYANYANAIFPDRPKAIEQLRYVRRDIDGSPLSDKLRATDIVAFWDALESGGLMDFASLLYYGAKLVSENQWICDGISARYDRIIVDEYQDTGGLALEILDRIRRAGKSRFMLVGDPRQRIYSFAGVSLDSLRDFAKALEPERQGLTGSYRCGAAICRDASNLFPNVESFHSNRNAAEDRSSTELIVTPTIKNAIVDYYLPKLKEQQIALKDAAILCSATQPLVALGESLRAAVIPVTGSPTRPYEESGLTAFAEAIAAFSRRPTPENWRHFQDAFFHIFEESEDVSLLEDYPAEAKACLNFASATALAARSEDILAILDQVFIQLNDFAESIDHPVKDLLIRGWEKLRKQLEGLSDIAMTLAEQIDSVSSLTLSTIHGAKGLEYRAVALIQFNNGVLPQRWPRLIGQPDM